RWADENDLLGPAAGVDRADHTEVVDRIEADAIRIEPRGCRPIALRQETLRPIHVPNEQARPSGNRIDSSVDRLSAIGRLKNSELPSPFEFAYPRAVFGKLPPLPLRAERVGVCARDEGAVQPEQHVRPDEVRKK